ncbi:hypothetical protein DRO61_12485 [Candidatus Bathyarchaeota archaeon]|nr:MAG: hypothetical protein DRO61_12485 [Candidatus Bathyarchaeota archaeon]
MKIIYRMRKISKKMIFSNLNLETKTNKVPRIKAKKEETNSTRARVLFEDPTGRNDGYWTRKTSWSKKVHG